MSTYTSTHRPKRLREGDRVDFSLPGEDPLSYVVERCYLHITTGGDNALIFRRFGLPPEITASRAYGYESGRGSWPESKPIDFAALCRLVNALYAEIDKRTARPKVGDKVKILEDCKGSEREGEIGVLLEDSNDFQPFHVAFEDGDGWWFHEGEIVTVKEATKAAKKKDEVLPIYKVGDYLEGINVQGIVESGICTMATIDDPCMTYELGFGHWISRASTKLVKAGEPPVVSLGWSWTVMEPHTDSSLADFAGLFSSFAEAMDDAKESQESPVYVFELFAGPVHKYKNKLVEETL